MRANFSTLAMLGSRPQGLNAHDVHNAGEVVGGMQRHLGGDLGKALHHEVRRSHPHLQSGEEMFHCLAAYPHRLRVFIEALLYSLQYVFMLPSP
jgi:hypothetical protein